MSWDQAHFQPYKGGELDTTALTLVTTPMDILLNNFFAELFLLVVGIFTKQDTIRLHGYQLREQLRLIIVLYLRRPICGFLRVAIRFEQATSSVGKEGNRRHMSVFKYVNPSESKWLALTSLPTAEVVHWVKAKSMAGISPFGGSV
ncbi:hypothetical protein C8R43DRAFT_955312 [Mycena crocata]|nr:hypothetical protein C8R43DRAFT_955312 [Mycena crocata]